MLSNRPDRYDMIWDSQVMSRNRRLIGRTKGRGCLAWIRMLGLASAPGSVRVPVDYEATPGDNLKFEGKKGREKWKARKVWRDVREGPARSYVTYQSVQRSWVKESGIWGIIVNPQLGNAYGIDMYVNGGGSKNRSCKIRTDYPSQIVKLFGRDLGFGHGLQTLISTHSSNNIIECQLMFMRPTDFMTQAVPSDTFSSI
ncbi:hypothetical protein TWF225_008014 [Orbilia oligospora]|uniref:Uncharacterized protein n=1 Tax=Orbilia oligospora TaxID=2813651 RepID=A0A8H2EC75_ORBOL|nr:hypothetical protein TWF225_008014 [Orbilia oligospora]KAF3243561.1 hypothetical protein TWF217_011234 [Orbilia oligospora]KAF3260068.1 hypothetical protein TWF128_003553 [Orbilia oligospora]KAF3280285.1 hypothetical protein TWF132_011844 [Orbilia oligospora]TGJ74903.1 hypothetical protein EYR41_001860 [Orbilia oligospora]